MSPIRPKNVKCTTSIIDKDSKEIITKFDFLYEHHGKNNNIFCTGKVYIIVGVEEWFLFSEIKRIYTVVEK